MDNKVNLDKSLDIFELDYDTLDTLIDEREII